MIQKPTVWWDFTHVTDLHTSDFWWDFTYVTDLHTSDFWWDFTYVTDLQTSDFWSALPTLSGSRSSGDMCVGVWPPLSPGLVMVLLILVEPRSEIWNTRTTKLMEEYISYSLHHTDPVCMIVMVFQHLLMSLSFISLQIKFSFWYLKIEFNSNWEASATK